MCVFDVIQVALDDPETSTFGHVLIATMLLGRLKTKELTKVLGSVDCDTYPVCDKMGKVLLLYHCLFTVRTHCKSCLYPSPPSDSGGDGTRDRFGCRGNAQRLRPYRQGGSIDSNTIACCLFDPIIFMIPLL